MYKIKLLSWANKNISEIINFISWDNLFYANKVYEYIYKSILLLKEFPFIWKPHKDWLREIVDPKYWFRIFYKVDLEDEIIYIISLFKYKNNWE